MNISKLIAKFVLASLVFSPIMQGVVLAKGENGKTSSTSRNQEIRKAADKDPVIPFPVKKSGTSNSNAPVNQKPANNQTPEQTGTKAPEAPANQNPANNQTSEKSEEVVKAGIAAGIKEVLTNLLATVKTDMLSFKGQAVNLYKGSLGSVQFSKEGALNMLAKVTPESTLGRAGVVAVIVTGGVVYLYSKKYGVPGAGIVRTVAGKVGNYVTLPSAATVAKGAAVLGAVSLAAAGLYAYKTGNVRPLANVVYPVIGVPALYAASQIAGYAKNKITSGVSNITSGAKTVASKAAKTAKSYTPNFVKSAASTVGSYAKLAGSYVPFVGGMITKKAYADFLTVFNKAHSKMSIKVEQLSEKKSELFNLISDQELKNDIQSFFVNLQNHKRNKKDAQIISTINNLHTKVKAKIEQIIK